MSKSILTIDTPNVCIDCPCHFAGESGMVMCGAEKRELLSDDIEAYKAEWCPLKEQKADCGGWIPCSERLPECGEGMFLACAENGYIFMAVRSYDGDFRDMYTIGLESFSEDNPIVAWQPLPIPYEVKEHG